MTQPVERRPRSILVGVGEQGSSDEAVRAALDLARRFEASVELVHAVPVPSPLWPSVDQVQLGAMNAEALTTAWNELSARFRRVFDDHGFGEHLAEDLLRVLPGHPAKVLLEHAQQSGADLIVLGEHRKRGVLDFGSTARAVLAKSHADVWVQPTAYREVRRILVPVDLSPESLAALERACALARELGASVLVLHSFATPEIAYSPGYSYPTAGPTYVVDEARAATQKEFERSMAEFDWGDLSHELRFLEGDPTVQILALQEQVDLVAMGTHGRTGLSAVVLGNVAYGVLKESKVPVLAIRHPDREWLTPE